MFGEQLAEDIVSAAQSPFVDIGLKRDSIPEKLVAIQGNPYARLKFQTCGDFTREIAELDAALGPDIDATFLQPPTSDAKSYLLEGGEIVRSSASGLVVSKVSILPLKGVVRRISGAEKHAKMVATAHQMGRLRRAYLKGEAAAYCPSLRWGTQD